MKIFIKTCDKINFSCYINYENNINIMKYTERLNNTNLDDYSPRSSGSFRRSLDIDLTSDLITNTNWEKESNYFNSVRINKRNMRSRTIKMNNKEWLKSKDGIETLKRNSNG